MVWYIKCYPSFKFYDRIREKLLLKKVLGTLFSNELQRNNLVACQLFIKFLIWKLNCVPPFQKRSSSRFWTHVKEFSSCYKLEFSVYLCNLMVYTLDNSNLTELFTVWHITDLRHLVAKTNRVEDSDYLLFMLSIIWWKQNWRF